MPLVREPGPFEHPDWLFELKHDGFRALAHVEGHRCTLVSRRRHVYKHYPMLLDEIAHSVRAMSCVLDGEIVCLASDGRSLFNRLLFRRDWPHFVAFDALAIDGEDLRDRPYPRAKASAPRHHAAHPVTARLHGSCYRPRVELFAAVCNSDLEGIVAKWKHGRYHSDGRPTFWLKVRNPQVFPDGRPARAVWRCTAARAPKVRGPCSVLSCGRCNRCSERCGSPEP